MWQKESERFSRSVIKVGIVVTASAALAAGATTLLAQSPNVVALPFVNAAAINATNTTVGIADPSLYFMTPAQVDRTLDEIQALGVNNVRVGIPWAGVEPYPGYYNWTAVDYMINAANERGMGVLAIISTTPTWASQTGAPALYGEPASPEQYGDFAGQVAERYAGKVAAYEIWNEPNGAMYFGPEVDPVGYTRLLQAAYPEIKAADPDALVIGGVVGAGLTFGDLTLNPVDFVDQMYDAGAQGYFDALSFHPYNNTIMFTQGVTQPESPIDQLAQIHELMAAHGDAEKQVWASEYGIPTDRVSEAQQAAYISDFLQGWSSLDYTGPAFIYTLRDNAPGATASESKFGVLREDFSPKPAAEVIEDWTQTHPQTVPDAVTLTTLAADTQQAATGQTLQAEPMAATEVPQTTLTTGETPATEAPAEESTAVDTTATPADGADADATDTTAATDATDSTAADATDTTAATDATDSTAADATDATAGTDTAGTTDADSTGSPDVSDASGTNDSTQSSSSSTQTSTGDSGAGGTNTSSRSTGDSGAGGTNTSSSDSSDAAA